MTIWELCDGRVTAVGDKGGAISFGLHGKTLEEAKKIGFFVVLREVEHKNHRRLARPEEHRTLAYRLDDVMPMSIEQAMDWLEDWNSLDNPLREKWYVDGAFLYDDFSKSLVRAYMPMKRGKISVSDRMTVYKKCGGHCAYCGKPIKYQEMQVDHVDSHYRHMGKDEIGNYLPSCRDCNGLKSDYLLEEFRDKLIPDCAKKATMGGRIIGRQDTRAARIAKAYGLDKSPKKRVVFYFETYKEESDMEKKARLDIDERIRDLMERLRRGDIDSVVLKLGGRGVSCIRKPIEIGEWSVEDRGGAWAFTIGGKNDVDILFDEAEEANL